MTFSTFWVATIHCRQQWSAWNVSMTSLKTTFTGGPQSTRSGRIPKLYGHKVLSMSDLRYWIWMKSIFKTGLSRVSTVLQDRQAIPTFQSGAISLLSIHSGMHVLPVCCHIPVRRQICFWQMPHSKGLLQQPNDTASCSGTVTPMIRGTKGCR